MVSLRNFQLAARSDQSQSLDGLREGIGVGVFILLFEPLPAVGQWISTRISEFENGVIELVDRRREKKTAVPEETAAFDFSNCPLILVINWNQ